jgi:hypothetical protein
LRNSIGEAGDFLRHTSADPRDGPRKILASVLDDRFGALTDALIKRSHPALDVRDN